MKKFLKGILDKLPFDGYKTAIGFILASATPFVPPIIPVWGFPFPAQAVVAKAALAFGGTGIVHNELKK